MKASVQGPEHLIKMLWVFIDRVGQTYTWEELVEVSQSGGASPPTPPIVSATQQE